MDGVDVVVGDEEGVVAARWDGGLWFGLGETAQRRSLPERANIPDVIAKRTFLFTRCCTVWKLGFYSELPI